ncbi:hydroxyphenylacetyl-CoA thioesterase PaaI [Thauera mechernichensis]|uniref:Hydroxyphenylacetyl-CoA thioesterase PaaI n=1 Tax=Thauera mechernichensis TaxID=82788 RepID=A0ABW3WHW2_9RHOO|nr:MULTISPECIES: hydroxyphenylacetyl-CoA thioesterase PaaI [Thauera]ENO81254.1 phenylacetic acid degradation protein PaaD [Thauera sp. 27]MDG3066501.1 hydroxyphenylacetyl-CoA thioesterase PaaI [Thauera mechernichensis]HNR61001.1 hydroxyphenylacetyl-CoA thioesterase PaaI [Thauera sp.]HNS93948.1 hydroxyphenylacetyl-CoA thioesterase PaaI [Thauera sp.]HRK12186.1 hydroxyphenylacetyl-CoA thioesterase PaaI [Thauera sp.]
MTDIQTIPTDPQALAEAVAAAMWSRDRAAQALGIRIEAVGPGTATLSMLVRGDMVNGHHICHGGLIFSLADTAFAYACNAYNRNTVASGCNIDFVAPGKEGDTLTAEAIERSASGRTGVYDITVRDSSGRTVALFRGKSYRIAGEVIAGLAAEQA